MKFRTILPLLFAVGYIVLKGVEGYRESKNWKSVYNKNGEMFVVNSTESDLIFENFKKQYFAQKNINEKELCTEIINTIQGLIIDGKISVLEMHVELEKLEEILNNPFLTNEGREHLGCLREVIFEQLIEYGKENPEFLIKLNSADIAQKAHRKILLDPDVVNLQKVLAEDGLVGYLRLAKKMSQSIEGREKLEVIFGDSTMDGESFLDYLEKIKID